jgi:hypothetical protein
VSVDVTVEEEIARPREEVARFAMDPGNDMRWIAALTSVRTLGDGPVGPGTRVERTASFLGRRMRNTGEPGRFYATAGPLLRAMVRRGVRRDLRKLKRVLEAT